MWLLRAFLNSAIDTAATTSAIHHVAVPNMQLLAPLLLEDCREALRWCLDRDRHHHKAAWQLACALARQGRHAEAAEQLRGLFSTPKRGFCISMWEMSEALYNKVPHLARPACAGLVCTCAGGYCR